MKNALIDVFDPLDGVSDDQANQVLAMTAKHNFIPEPLLKAIETAFNEIPNTKISNWRYGDTYTIASHLAMYIQEEQPET